uniref:J domain-containing protein n=1 Tax=Aegilops tauschii subsp. strangulata TaxID=200361 RepID=A0A453B175_AEGTS
ELERDADEETIKVAYRRLAKFYHPDGLLLYPFMYPHNVAVLFTAFHTLTFLGSVSLLTIHTIQTNMLFVNSYAFTIQT